MASKETDTKSSTSNTVGKSPSSSELSNDDQQNSKKTTPLTPGELSRPTNIQRIQQKKTQIKALSRVKKLEKLAVYSSCKVWCSFITFVILVRSYEFLKCEMQSMQICWSLCRQTLTHCFQISTFPRPSCRHAGQSGVLSVCVRRNFRFNLKFHAGHTPDMSSVCQA